MDTSDWINLIAAILIGGGTLFLGIMAWRNIRQTRNIQKAEKRERLLNEIIEWAVANIKATHGQDIMVVSLTGNALRSALYYGFLQLNSRSEYIKRAASIFDRKFNNLVNEVIEILETCEKDHAEWVTCIEKEKDEKMKVTLVSCKALMKKSTALIAEATKIKVKDIS